MILHPHEPIAPCKLDCPCANSGPAIIDLQTELQMELALIQLNESLMSTDLSPIILVVTL